MVGGLIVVTTNCKRRLPISTSTQTTDAVGTCGQHGASDRPNPTFLLPIERRLWSFV